MNSQGNVWLKRIEDRKPKKFVGKFQEAGKVNINKRIYPSFSKQDLKAGGTYVEHVNKDPVMPAQQMQAHHAVPAQQLQSVEERWLPPSEDECGWIPIRPNTTPEIELDLSQVKGSNDRYKAYDRLRLQEDAMIIYGDPTAAQKKQQKLEELKLQIAAQNPMILGVSATELAGQGLFVQGGTVTISDKIDPQFVFQGEPINVTISGTVDNMGAFTLSASPASMPGAITITGMPTGISP